MKIICAALPFRGFRRLVYSQPIHDCPVCLARTINTSPSESSEKSAKTGFGDVEVGGK